MPRPRSQSPLRTPLNEIFRSEAQVRLLRALALADTPLGAGELARRAHLGRTGVYPALASLEQTGIVELVGAGPSRQVMIRTAHPLAAPIAALFRAEAERIEALVSALRDVFTSFRDPVISAWIAERGGEEPAGDTAPVTCYVVADPASLPDVVDRLEDRLLAIERDFHVEVEVIGLSRSEVAVRVPAASLDGSVLLAGVPPVALLPDAARAGAKRTLRAHADHDIGERLLAVAVAAKQRRDPGIVRRKRAQLRAQRGRASAPGRREREEWLRILSTMPPGRLRRFLSSDSERAVRLRQSLPAVGILTPAERRMVLAAASEDEVLEAMARGQ